MTDVKFRKRGVDPIPPHEFPKAGLVRIHELASHSGKKGLFPLSVRTWERGVKDGHYPKPIVLHGTRFWRAEDVRAVIEGQA